ncbi:MAG: hypothetical protein GY768_00510 [Planctomycetaceae bacterium]|nr:hypothetical protein [Planctomycetaceae bacterium]
MNVDRAIALGLVDRTPADHAGGIIRNNFIYQEPNLFSPSRQTNSDGQILVWDSENTKVYHNTVLTNGNSRRAIEFRWATRGSLAVNNLSDAPIGKRSGATYVASGNQLNATPEMFVDPENGNLHLKQDEGVAIDAVDAPPEAATDIDGQVRPGDGKADVGADEKSAALANARPVISVSPVRDELLENDPREEGLLVATFAVVDDELGTNHVWLAGEDAAKFVISGEDVFLKSGVSLDFEMNPVLELSVLVDDPSIGAAVDAQQEINLRIVDVNEPPRLQVVGLLEMVSEGEDLLSGLKVADVYVLDDALGDNQLSLDGEDAEGFELRGSELLIKSGVVLDFESKPLLELTVSVNDLEMGNGVDDFVDVQIGVISLNVPIVDLDADNSSGDSGFVAEFRAGTEPVLIADDDFRLIDPNGRDLIEATVTIANSLPGDRLQLLGRLSGPIEIDLSSTESTFRLVGKASVSAYRETLSHLSYYNPTDIRNTDDRIVTVQVTNDLGLESVLESALVKVRRSLPTWLQAPDLPAPTGNVVAVSSEPELQAAMSNLQAGTTIVLAPGVYQLTKTLWVRQDDVTIRGQTNDHDDVVLIGKGMDNANFGRVPHGIWSNASKTRIQNLTILNVYHHPIQFAETAHAPHVYNVLMLNAGEQFVKASRGNGTGIVGGIVEYSIMEYTNGPPKTNHGGGIGYTNGVDVHGGQGWLVRNNLFKNFHTPDNARHLWNPAVLFWNQARDTIVEGNTFINVDRAIALGLVDRTPADHAGGIIRNNFIYQEPDLFSPSRQTNSDGQILVWDSENTKVYHNTVLTNGNSRRAIEFRWSTRGSLAVNNLSDAPIGKRSGATYVASGNQLNATPEMFVDPENGNLHLKQDEGAAIDVVDAPPEAATDIDGQVRPGDGKADVGADQRREPFADLYGDVNLDAVVDSRDIDELSRHVRSGDYRESSDLNRDGVLSELDRETLVLKVLDSAFGDSSLDGIFSSSDLVKAFQAGEYEDELVGNSTWSTGDWNGDGEFTSADFIMAFQAGGYVNGARSA